MKRIFFILVCLLLLAGIGDARIIPQISAPGATVTSYVPTYCLLFDATAEKIAIADNAKFDWTPVTQARSFTCTYKCISAPTSGNAHVLFLPYYASGNFYEVAYYNNGGTLGLYLIIYNSSWTVQGFFATDVTLTTNTTYKLAFVASTDGNCKIYINKVSQSVTHDSWDDTTGITPNATQIGNGGLTLAGSHKLADIALFNTAITQTYVNNLDVDPTYYDDDASCLFSMHLDENTGNPNDVQTTYTQTDGTITGATWTTW